MSTSKKVTVNIRSKIRQSDTPKSQVGVLFRLFFDRMLTVTFLMAVISLWSFDLTASSWLVADVSRGEDRGEVIAVDTQGRIVVAGTADATGKADFVVVRFLTDGRVDPSFGEKGRRFDLGADDFVHALGIDRKGRIVVGGFRARGGRSDFALIRLLPNGELDARFGDGGIVIHDLSRQDEIHYLAIQRDGKIVVAGFTGKPRAYDFSLLRFDDHGKLDPAFGERGMVRIDQTREDRLYGLALQSDGKIVATGSLKQGGEEDCAVVRISPSGKSDLSFGHEGLVVIPMSRGQDICAAVATSPGGKIWIVGFASRRGRDTDFSVARLTTDGRLDETFGDRGILLKDFEGGIDVAHAVAVDRDGQFLVAGEYQKKPSTLPFRSGLAFVSGNLSAPLFLESDPSRNSLALALTVNSGRAFLAGVSDDTLAVLAVPLR